MSGKVPKKKSDKSSGSDKRLENVDDDEQDEVESGHVTPTEGMYSTTVCCLFISLSHTLFSLTNIFYDFNLC